MQFLEAKQGMAYWGSFLENTYCMVINDFLCVLCGEGS